ncbi:MAG: neutral/alkaline non-lysosomal ceramidase N-terminal domain-containing protein, partial [Bacteroidetes bacterium]|nr:neutral/alkaline non-lysosomal ceramidase N-terminal domain-containing protein [Bacteroidota bacterium]
FAYQQPEPSSYQWKAGVAKININPVLNMWIGGFASRTHPATGRLTDLWAKALALQDENGKKVVFVGMDLGGIREGVSLHVKAALKKKYGLGDDQIMLNCTHNHSGPTTNLKMEPGLCGCYGEDMQKMIVDYTKELEQKLIKVAGDALESLKPAKVFSGNGMAKFAVNRRSIPEDMIQWKSFFLEGPNDFSVPVIKVVDENNKINAILFGYACHNTTLHAYSWSGDYAGYAQIDLEKEYPGATAIFFQGAGGDQNPLPRDRVALAKQYGGELALAVKTVIEDTEKVMKPLISKAATGYTEFNLGLSKEPPTREELIRIINDTTSSRMAAYEIIRAQKRLKTYEEVGKLRDTFPYPIMVWKLGDQPIFGLAGELVVGYSINIKEIYGLDAFVFGYTTYTRELNYIPTTSMFHEGNYEVLYGGQFLTPWEFDIETKIMTHTINLANKVGIPKVSWVNTENRYK